MVRARRRVLERGHYEPLGRVIVERSGQHLSLRRAPDGSETRRTIVDVGCGEGYYIGGLERVAASTTRGGGDCFLGLDVSKEALRLAARTYTGVRFFVNDVKQKLSLADDSVDLLLNIFAPRNPGEFGRVIRRGGVLIVVIPSDDHLKELRAELPLLGVEPDKLERTVRQLRGAFHLVGEEELEYPAEMATDDIVDLLRMTPNYWHLGETTLADAVALGDMEITLGFSILRFQRTGSISAGRRA